MHDIASPRDVFGVCDGDRLCGRYGWAQCSARILGHNTAQKGAAAEDRASVIRRPEISSRAPARSTLSRKRRRLQPVPVAAAIARRAMCMIPHARHEISSRTSLHAKASTAGVFYFSVLPRLIWTGPAFVLPQVLV